MYCYEYDTGTRYVQYIKNDFKTEQLSFTSNVKKFSLRSQKKMPLKKYVRIAFLCTVRWFVGKT